MTLPPRGDHRVRAVIAARESSRHIDAFLMLEDMPPSDVVFASLDGFLFDNIDLSTDDRLQLFLHLDPAAHPWSPVRLRFIERNQDVDIAVRAKFIRQDRAKQRKLP